MFMITQETEIFARQLSAYFSIYLNYLIDTVSAQ